MDTLTRDDVTALTQHFKPAEHEFVRGYIYISEQAITTRLDDVDPAWSWIIVDEHPRDNQMIVKGRLTVKGVIREGVGMQPLTIVVKDTGEIKEGTEPEKSAATDALKRAARLFGIGRYLLDTPGWVKTVDNVATWLKQSNGNSAPLPASVPQRPEPSVNGAHDPAHTHIGNDQPATPKAQTPATPVVKNDTKIEALSVVTAEPYTGKGNKSGIRFKTSTGSYSYTRQPFTDAGIDTELWTEPALYSFGQPFNVISKWQESGYWKIERLDPMGKNEAELFNEPRIHAITTFEV